MSGTNRGLNKLEQAQYLWNQGRFREAGKLYRNMLLENPELARSGLSINLAHSIILATDWSDVSKNLPQGINYLESSGWIKSLSAGKPVNCEFKPVPWYTYPAIEFIENKLNKNFRVFEFGSGNSTLWFSERVLQVVCVESNSEWFSYLQENISSNVELNWIEEENKYASKIFEYPKEYFDIIAIDGINRNKCAESAISRLKQNGFIIFDNTDDRKYNPGIEILSKKGFKRIDFYGLIPSYTYKNCTSVFFKDDEFLFRGELPSEKLSCLGKSCFQISNPTHKITKIDMSFGDKSLSGDDIETTKHTFLLPGDYVSPGFLTILPDTCFPHLIIGDKSASSWRYSRREIPHNRYVDRRVPAVGFINRDEAHILYNTALKFKGKQALEIGCWLGWSACHLALAGVELDVIDPLLAEADFHASVSDSLAAAGVFESVNLIPGYSPQKVEELVAQFKRKWSLIFIDGNHEAPGPLTDAIACEKVAATDALVLFHDLASPDVAQGLDYFKQKGWNTMIYQSAQIMGVAWRGNVEPVQHQPDPKVQWSLPEHLKHYPISGLQPELPENSKIPLQSAENPLIPINLNLINLIVFPDWSQPEEDLCSDLERVIRVILNHPQQKHLTLLIEASSVAEEEAALALSGILMKILMEEELDMEEDPGVSVVRELSERQWSALLPRIQCRIKLKNENQQMVEKGANLSVIQIDDLQNGQLPILYPPSLTQYRHQILQLVQNNPGQLSVEEYSYIVDTVSKRTPSNFLIFGVGKDSGLWLEINKNGKTVFLEDNADWLEQMRTISADADQEAYLVEYRTQLKEWLDLLVQYHQGSDCLSLELPAHILQTKWDFIFVDAPAGYSEEMPGRMKSIYMAAQLANQNSCTDVFVHDCDRIVENLYTEHFFAQKCFVTQVFRLKHYKIES